MERLKAPDPGSCVFALNIDGNLFGCVKKKGHIAKSSILEKRVKTEHVIEGPIVFRSSKTGFVVEIEGTIRWTEEP